MPAPEHPKLIPYPTQTGKPAPVTPTTTNEPPYGELQISTNYTFLTGASHPEEYVHTAQSLGYQALAITDTHTLGGAVRMHVAAKDAGLPLAIGCRLQLRRDERPPLELLVYPTDRAGYGALCQLLTLGKLRAPKGDCWLELADVLDHEHDWLAVLLPPAEFDELFRADAARLRERLTNQRLSLAATCAYTRDNRTELARIAQIATELDIPLAATNAVAYHEPARKPLHDVLACIRHGCTVRDAGYRLQPNAEQHLKPPAEMHRLFAAYPRAIRRSLAILRVASQFSLDELRYEYPHETCPPGKTRIEHLTDLTWQGAHRRYPEGVSEKTRAKLNHELTLIAELDYPSYFLTVHDIVHFARSRGILCQGRGAAANSAVCFCLGITEVDPARVQLLFERFISKERDEPPDIDIDFEHERREEVIQYIYEKYGRDRAALTAEVITYRPRSAIRDVGKALGLPLDCVDRLAKGHDWFDETALREERVREMGFNPEDRTLRQLHALVAQLLGFPRHRSQHVGGFVMTEGPLCETVPTENAAMPDRTVIEWDKDDIDALRILKVDVLGLGMLTCVRKCFELIEQHTDAHYEMATVPAEDPAVYDMICEADTVGVFQIESRAQMSMLPRLRPRCYYDLVIEVAIVRPGPIQGGMVHPYLRRRNGEEPVTYPSDDIRDVLERTLGVPLFQEQAMALAVRAAGFTPGEADQLRRSMAAWKRSGHLIHEFGQRIIRGMLAKGYERGFAERCFEQIRGFGEYGFPESHAASFALIVYVSCWQKHHHLAAFVAALINSQPMGFYAPAQLVQDAKAHGVEIRPVDVNHSDWDCTLEPADPGTAAKSPFAIRLGLRLVNGLREAVARRVVATIRECGPVRSVESLWRRGGASAATCRRLAEADAFISLGLDRQQALWAAQSLRDEVLPLFEQVEPAEAATAALPAITLPETVVEDYRTLGLSLKAHPVQFLRARLDRLRITPNDRLADRAACPNGRPISVAGIVLLRQRPGTASGIVFMTIEDETGIANLIVRPRVFDLYRRIARHSPIVIAQGQIERDSTTGKVVHVMVQSFRSIELEFGPPRTAPRNFH